MRHKAVLLKGTVEFKVNTLLKVKGEFEVVDDDVHGEHVHALDMLDSLYSEWMGLPVFHIVEYECLTQADLLPRDLPSESLTDTKRKVVDFLANLLSGDEIAAEYLLMHLVSKMYFSLIKYKRRKAFGADIWIFSSESL